LTQLGFERPFIVPVAACGVSVGVAKKAARDWTSRDHRKHWDSLSGLRQEPSAKKRRELLNVNRDQIRPVIGLLLLLLLFKLGLANSCRCERCLKTRE
jgi:hypothetical protein